MQVEVDSDEAWMGLRELFTDEPIVPPCASSFELEVGNGARLRVEQSVAAFARAGEASSADRGTGADDARVTGALLWDSSVVLARVISRQLPLLPAGARVVELGAGLGLCGLAAAAAGFAVVLTDREEVLPLTRACYDANAAALAVSSGSAPRIEIRPLFWGDAAAAAALRPPLDCVVMADCVYELESIPPLIACLRQLCGPQTLVLSAYDVDIGRHAAYAAFEQALAAAGFSSMPLDPAAPAHESGCSLEPVLKHSIVLQQLRLASE